MTPEGGHDAEAAASRGTAGTVAVWVELDAAFQQPLVLAENSGELPVYGLTVCVFHFASVMSGGYPVDEPLQGRQTLTGFTAALARWYGTDDGGELARQAQFLAGYAFRDVDDRWWCRTSDGILSEADDGEDASRRAFLTAPRDRSGPQMWHIVH